MFCKFKQFFYISYCKFSALYYWLRFPSRRILNKKFWCSLVVLGVLSVIFEPCLVKFCFSGFFQEVAKSNNCRSVLIKSSEQQIIGVYGGVKGGILESRQFRVKCVSKLSGGVIEFLSPVSAYGEEMPSKEADNCCECRMSKDVDKKLRQAVTSFFFNSAAGISVGILILRLYYGSFY